MAVASAESGPLRQALAATQVAAPLPDCRYGEVGLSHVRVQVPLLSPVLVNL